MLLKRGIDTQAEGIFRNEARRIKKGKLGMSYSEKYRLD